jgi:hypothetical protein
MRPHSVIASALILGQACSYGKAYLALVHTGRGPLLVFRLPRVTRYLHRLRAFQAPACADRGVLAQVMVPTDERPQEGQLALSVELSALCSPDARPGRFSEAANCLNEQARVAEQPQLKFADAFHHSCTAVVMRALPPRVFRPTSWAVRACTYKTWSTRRLW